MLCSKFSMKMHDMHKKCDLNEKERVKETYSSLKTKTLEEFEEEKNKNDLDSIRWEKTVRGVFEKVWKVWRTLEKLLFKTLTNRFSISRKLASINQASIEHQSSQADSNQSFYRIFDRSSNRFNRSKIWKNENFEMQSNFMQKLLKA